MSYKNVHVFTKTRMYLRKHICKAEILYGGIKTRPWANCWKCRVKCHDLSPNLDPPLCYHIGITDCLTLGQQVSNYLKCYKSLIGSSIVLNSQVTYRSSIKNKEILKRSTYPWTEKVYISGYRWFLSYSWTSGFLVSGCISMHSSVFRCSFRRFVCYWAFAWIQVSSWNPSRRTRVSCTRFLNRIKENHLLIVL